MPFFLSPFPRRTTVPNPLNDVQQLQQDLAYVGVGIKALYSTRYNVNLSGSNITSIGDALGLSVPALTATGSVAFDAINKTWTVGGGAYLKTAPDAAFELSTGCTVVYIGTLPSGNYPVGIADAGTSKYMALKTQASTVQTSVSAGGAITTAVNVGGPSRLSYIGVTGVNAYGVSTTPTGLCGAAMVYGNVGNRNQFLNQVISGSGFVSGGFQLSLGHFSVGGDSGSVGSAVLVLDTLMTGAAWQIIKAWADTYERYTSAAVNTRVLVSDGNSVTAASGLSSGQDYASLLMLSPGFTTNFDYVNTGISGRTGATQLAGFNWMVSPVIASGYSKSFYLSYEVGNSIVAGDSGATAAGYIVSMCQAAKARGATKTVAISCLPRTGFSGAQETQRLAANAILAALPSGVDIYVNATGNPNLSDPTNMTYYQVDSHPTLAGQQEIATNPIYGIAAALTPSI